MMVQIQPELIPKAPGLLDRDQWDKAVDFHIGVAEATGKQDLSVVFIDVNFFKRVNDSIGYSAGDQVIEDIGDLLVDVTNRLRIHPRTHKRESDIVALDEMIDTKSGLWGGDEFSVLAHTDESGTEKLVERIRDDFDEYIEDPRQQKLKELGIGLSIGAAQYRPGMTREELVTEASEDMKQDKHNQLPKLTPHEEKARRIIEEQLSKVDRPDIILRHLDKR